MPTTEYGADSIIALEGLSPVFERPGMYIGDTDKRGFHHLLWEVVDNSVDEAMAGHCDLIEVVLNQDGSATVTDNGRGIPVAPQTSGTYKGMPTVELALTVLHAGGKFKDSYGGYTGGLHGVGISVVNALSEWLKVEVIRDGQRHSMEFGLREKLVGGESAVTPGVVTKRLTSTGRYPKSESGTSITFLPTPRKFKSVSGWDCELISRRIRQAAFLNPGLTFTLTDAREDDPTTVTYHYPNGLVDFMEELAVERLGEGERQR